MKKRLLIIVLTLVMITSLFIGIGITASAAGRIIDITQEANLTVTNKIANIYYVQGLREYHEQRDANNWTKFFGQWAWVLSEQDARAKLNELMRSPSSMDSQPSILSVNSPNNEPANFRLNGEKADTLLIWAKAQPMSVNEGGYYYALLPMPKEITFTTNLNSSYSISSVDSKTLTVEATCADYDGEPTYQWYYCGTTSRKDSATPIDGATGKSCTVKPATAKESHYYFCRVTAGEVVGDSVVAGVYASDPYVYINNTDKLYGTCYAVTGKPYTMGITNTSNNVASGELCYQWYRCTDSEGNGAEAIEGATTDSFDVPTGTKGTYYYFGKAYIKLNGSEICSARTQVAKVIVRDAHKITPVGTPGEDGYTIVEFGKFYFTGYSLQDDLTCPTNETCKLTYEPDDGYTVDKILVYKTGEPETTVDLEEWDSDTKQFTMPDFDITVEVTFKKLESIEKVDLTVDWSRVPSVNVGDNVLNVRFNEYYDWAVFVDGVGAVNGPVGMTIFTVKVTDNNKKEICDAIVASGFDGLTPDDLTDMLEMLGCGAWLHPEFLFGINGYVVKENDELAIMPFVYPYSGYFPVVGDAMFGAYNGVVTCNGEPVSNSAVFGDASMSMLFPFIEVGTVSDLAAKKNAAKTEVSDVFYYDELGYTTGGSYGVMPGIAAEGETITIRVTPEEGYEVDTVTWQPFIMASDEGDDINVVTLVDGKYTFTMPAQSVMVKVTFKKIAAPHEHEYTYTSNNNGTHNGACECGEDAITNEACTYGNDEVCDLCGYDSHEHEYTYTSNNNGTHNGTCECGEDAITNEACTYGNDEVCDLCGYDSHEHEYTYTSNNNGTHNGTCECGEDAITNEACTYGNDEVCDLCGYDSHEHEYTYTSNNNGTHNGTCECGEDAITNEACAYVGGQCDKCGYAEPATSPTVNVPVSNGDNKVDVEAEISGNDATIKPLDEERINELIGTENTSGDVVIDLSKLGESINTAGIPKATLEAIVNAAEDANNNTEYLVIKLSTAELKLDDTAMRAIVDQANGDVIKFNFDDVGLGRLNETQKDAIKGMDVRKGYEAYITVNDQRIGDFNGGEVEIIVPYAVPEGEDIASFSVWYIDDDGTLEKQQSTYDGKEKCFIVNHFSDYVIVYSAEDAPTTEGDGMWIVWVILIILIILICVITYYIYKKRKSRENEA